MYGDILTHYKSCPQRAFVNASGKINSGMCIPNNRGTCNKLTYL